MNIYTAQTASLKPHDLIWVKITVNGAPSWHKAFVMERMTIDGLKKVATLEIAGSKSLMGYDLEGPHAHDWKPRELGTL